jgi:hypothetical protein
MTNWALRSGKSFVNKNVLAIPGDRQFPVLPAFCVTPKGKPRRLTDDFFEVMKSLRAIWVTQANLRNQALTFIAHTTSFAEIARSNERIDELLYSRQPLNQLPMLRIQRK